MILLRMVAFRPAAVIDETLKPGDLAPAEPAAKEAVAREVDDTVKKSDRAPAEPPAELSVECNASPPQTQAATPTSGGGREGHCGMDPQQKIALGELEPWQWHHLLEQLGLGGIVYTIAINSELRSCSGNTLQFVLDQANAALFNKGHVEQIRAALEKYFGEKLVVTIAPGETATETPARRQARLQQERQQAAVASIEADPLLQKLIARFDGELDRASITPVDP
jgi:DNA polymerase-3 subunit gamma/tau